MSEGLYFVNCQNDAGDRRSGIAFYEDLGANNLNLNEQPKDFVYTDELRNTFWELGQDQGE
jgi:hypothetical protein